MINRRDFLKGCALSVAAGSAISPLEALAQGALNPYALPTLTPPPARIPILPLTRLIEQSRNLLMGDG